MMLSSFLPMLMSFAAVNASRNPFSARQTFTSAPLMWRLIPRGGGDKSTDAPVSSGTVPDLSSLFSGISGFPGIPDLSKPPSMEQMQQSMAQFQALLASPQFRSILSDPSKMEEQVENIRQAVLSGVSEMEKGDNPLMTMMMEQLKIQLAGMFPGGWEGLKLLVENDAKWKEMMLGFLDVLKSMGEEDWGNLLNQIGGAGMGSGDISGIIGGFPQMDTTETLAGLDELSED